MAVFDVTDLTALEILDSRGQPTLAVTVRLADGNTASARVPSGASTGSREASERRDGDPARYRGRGVLGAAAAVNIELADLLRGRSWARLADVDQAMIDLDGTANKSGLGANATVGVSMAPGPGASRLRRSAAVAVAHTVAKYNRLLEIAAVAPGLRYGMP